MHPRIPPNPPPHCCASGDTKTRLLDAAEELFAQKGFEAVSVRDLATAAAVNVAAVNYHFQGKENLLREVIVRRFAHQRNLALAAVEKALQEDHGELTLEWVVRSMVHGYLQGSIGQGKPTFMGLIARDLHTQGNVAPDVFFKELVAPVYLAFSRALQKTWPRLQDEDLHWIIASIVSQVHHFTFRWEKKSALAEDSEILQTMHGFLPALAGSLEEYVEQVSDHITRFSCAAIRALFPEV